MSDELFFGPPEGIEDLIRARIMDPLDKLDEIEQALEEAKQMIEDHKASCRAASEAYDKERARKDG